ncbi:DUF1853 family protein [Exilibacterium tricleocarpae]|uniref:DUF1853 family protein n=1 Tax=Exilibacterium tricleocarpae TaxID=2591008 RepID=A0A545TUW2_9GAMM|nr:DUF1853 family protein [Exilibacterium tricleocarpae]TQV81007.1 DUF1853 family protein [Exilibacterium tricleocarpae]
MIWNVYHQPQVRDLAWCLFSPPLMAQLPARHAIDIDARTADTAQRRWLSQLDKAPAPLLQHLADRPTRRLGIYFENLLSFFYRSSLCRQCDQLSLRAQNLQIAEGGKTLGEFDFLLQSHASAQVLHTEAAVKFYLGTPAAGAAASDWRQWLGPGCRDRLDIKLTHLIDRQLQLSRQPAAQAILRARDIDPQQVTPLALLRGVLLYPAHTSVPAPTGAHPGHLRGTWHYLEDFLARQRPHGWEWLPRLRWLAPTHPGQAVLYSAAEVRQHLLEHFTKQRQPVMLRNRTAAAPDPQLHMIVPDYWPWTT